MGKRSYRHPNLPLTVDAPRHPGTTPHQRYETAKARWIAAHPEATPRDYEAAMTRLAREAGI